MLIPAGFAFVIGAVFALRYKVGALVPAAAMLLFCAVFDGVVHGSGAWSILITCVLALTCLEFGYLLSSAMQFLLLRDRSSEEDPEAGGTEALPRAAPRLKPNWYEEGSPKTSSDVVYMPISRRNVPSAPSLSRSPDAPASHLHR